MQKVLEETFVMLEMYHLKLIPPRNEWVQRVDLEHWALEDVRPTPEGER